MADSKAVPDGFEPFNLGPGFTEAFGPVYRHVSETKLGFRVELRHMNPVDACHGGAMATFADMQIAVLKPGLGTQGGHLPTVSLSVDYLAPARLGAWVVADVMLVKTTRTLVFTQAMITVDGAVVARSSGIYRNFAGKPEQVPAP